MISVSRKKTGQASDDKKNNWSIGDTEKTK
jgi:hypothetical protein